LTFFYFPLFLFALKRIKGETKSNMAASQNPEQILPEEEWPEELQIPEHAAPLAALSSRPGRT